MASLEKKFTLKEKDMFNKLSNTIFDVVRQKKIK